MARIRLHDEGPAEDAELIVPPGEADTGDRFEAEGLEGRTEAIGPPLEDDLHVSDALSRALLDEGETFDDLDEDADTVEWAVEEAAERDGREETA